MSITLKKGTTLIHFRCSHLSITVALIWLSVLAWSPLGVKKYKPEPSLSHAQIGLL